jgi:sortase A
VPGPLYIGGVAALLAAATAGVVVISAAETSIGETQKSVRQNDSRRPLQHPGDGATSREAPDPQDDALSGSNESVRTGNSARTAHARRMIRATMRIPEIGLHGLTVVPYRGSPDDGPGTRIQNGGDAATPIGPRGGVGPGQIGNYIVTGHRTTSPAPFAELPALRRGDHVLVRAAGREFDYRVTDTRRTSFRSRRSLARQSAAVPGRPGMEPTRAMITLSTCATPEDHARGNYWSDEFDNPEHRIDKIGVLVDVRAARPSRNARSGGG